MESATTAAWVAAGAAVVAGPFAGWSAAGAHRAVVLERDRRHHELAPRIEVKDSAASTADELSLGFTTEARPTRAALSPSSYSRTPGSPKAPSARSSKISPGWCATSVPSPRPAGSQPTPELFEGVRGYLPRPGQPAARPGLDDQSAQHHAAIKGGAAAVGNP
jgi:hypothetical protein